MAIRTRPVPVLALVVACVLVACGSAVPSPTVRPELAWSRATIDLPKDVVDIAPGSSGGMICSPCHAVQASLMTGVTATTDGLLAVGIQLPPSTAVAYRSVDGRTWDPEPGFSLVEETAAQAVAAGDAETVIVGSRGLGAAAWLRPAGASTWTAADDADLSAGGGATAEMRAVTAWKGGFVAAGSRGAADGSRTAAIWTTTDGTDWVEAADEEVFGDATATGVAASSKVLVGVGSAGPSGTGPAVVWRSEDGAAWTRVASPSFAGGSMRAVTATPAGFVAVGVGSDDDRAMAWTSVDGSTWAAAPTTPALENFGKAIRMLAVATGPDGVVAAGWQSDAGNGSGVVWTSRDGTAWERLPDQVSMSGASLSGAAVLAGTPAVVGTSGYPDNDQASAWHPGS